jgi:hypothetical protein
MSGVNGMGGREGGLGDIINNDLLRSIDPQWVHLGRRRWIVKPEWVPTKIPELELVQKLIDNHMVPRLWQLLADNYTLLQRGSFHVQKPGWIDPPVTSEPEDRVSETPVALSTGVAVTVLSYTVPDRHYAVFKSFGHMLDVGAQFGTVSWTIQVNKRPYRTYNKFLLQRGTIVQPTLLAKPLILKPKDLLEITATGGVTAVNATVRIMGWSIGAASVVQDGTNWGVQVR